MHKSYITVLALVFAATVANARGVDHLPNVTVPTTAEFQGTDLMPLVRAIQPKVKLTTRPFYTYNWSAADMTQTPWSEIHDAKNPVGVQRALGLSQSYWNRFGAADSENWFGSGFYVALDPIISKDFAGRGFERFIMLQAQIPQGFRYIQLKVPGRNGNSYNRSPDPSSPDVVEINAAAKQALQQFNCTAAIGHRSSDNKDYLDLYELFKLANRSSALLCGQMMRKVLDEALKIDGFFYSWYGATFPGSACQTNELKENAMVITNGRFVNANRIRLFTPLVRDSQNERMVLQSLFYRAGATNATVAGGYPATVAGQAAHGVYVMGFRNPYEEWLQDVILWPDLLNRPLTQNIDNWIEQNLVSCRGM